MNKKFIYFKTKTQFTAKLSSLPNNAIVFIEDTKQIWTHGVFFDTSWNYVGDKPDTYAPSAHSHGPITNDGKIGTLTDRIIETTTGGLLTHVAKNTAYNRDFGTGVNQVAMGNHTHPYLPLSGGTLSNSSFGGSLTIHRIAANNSTIKFTATSGNPWYIGMDVVTGEFGVVNSAVGITTSKVKLNGSSGLITGTGFSKTGATDAHVLLGSGGHKAISDFNASLVTSTTTSGTTNVATSNTNTYLNIVQGGTSVGSSTQIVGSNGVTVASDTTGKLTITGLGAHAGIYSSRANGLGASSNSIEAKDTRNVNPLPNTDLQRGVWFDFKTNSAIGLTGASTYSSVMTMVPYRDNSGNSNTSFRLAQSGNNLYFQNWTTVWGTWNKIWHSGNFANGTTSQYIRGDGSLATYANTTYSAMSVAEGTTGTATSSRTMRADYLKQIIQYYNVDTNSVTGIRAGASGTTTNAAATNPYIKVLDDSTYRSQIRLLGGGATTVTSDASGNVTISSTNTVYTHPTGDGNLHVPATGTSNYGKVLKAGSTAGSISWGTLSYSDIGAASQQDLDTKINANKFQVVAALPASPTVGVFYFVKE